MASRTPMNLRTDYRDVCDCEGGRIQTYVKCEHVPGKGADVSYGARIVGRDGLERVYTEGYSDPGTAVKWIKLAIGLAAAAVVWAGVHLLPKFLACFAVALPFWMAGGCHGL